MLNAPEAPSNLQARIAQRVQEVSQKSTQPDSCWSGSVNDNAVEYVTIKVPTVASHLGGATCAADLIVKFQTSHKLVFIASIDDSMLTSSIFMHFQPLGKQPQYDQANSTKITPFGSENWIPLYATDPGGSSSQGKWIKFAKPIQQFFVDADHPSGAPLNNGGLFYYVTFGGTDDIEFLFTRP